MTTWQEMLQCLKVEPFRPFRIHITGGRKIDVRRPKVMRVGRETVLLFTPTAEDPDKYDRWETVALTRIERTSQLEVPEE